MPPKATVKPVRFDMVMARNIWGLSQINMAKVLGVHRRTYQGWEKGEFPVPLIALDAINALTKKKIKDRLTAQ